MAPALVNNQFQVPTILVLPGLTRVFPDGTLGCPRGYCGLQVLTEEDRKTSTLCPLIG